VPHAEALRGEGTPPAIVTVSPPGHRGGWDPLAQWLAHRGYAVMVLADAGNIAAGTAWLGAEGIADAKRVGFLEAADRSVETARSATERFDRELRG